MGKSATKDMTAGAPLKLILQFFVPMFFGMLFQQFYNMMDTIIVGKALGVNALAAVGATGSINFCHRILHGRLQWVCDTGCATFWSGRLPCAAQICGEQCMAFRNLCRCDDGGGMCAVQTDPALDAHPTGYF